jgi:hypothetical protein
MIVALFALAATMIVAGVTAVVEGFPYVRLESGMAMVYGGSVVGSSGVLLLGLAVVASGLKRVERAVRSGLTTAAEPAAAAPVSAPLADELQVMVLPPENRPRIEPSLSSVAMPEPARPHAAEPELPMPGLSLVEMAEAKPPEAPPAPKPVPEVVLPPAPTEEPVTAPLRSSLDVPPEPAREEKAERTAVGRYSSGGNTYVMFDDGSIEADTPTGRYTFGSLDELKAFVDGGGEKSARGAA